MLQMMNKVFGGTVHRKSVREDGVFNIALDNTCSLFRYSPGSAASPDVLSQPLPCCCQVGGSR